MKIVIFLIFSLTILSASEAFLPEYSDISIEAAHAQLDMLGASIPCTLCDKVVGFAVKKIAKSGCGFLLKVEMAAVCEAAGLGPEDPLADACVVALVGACAEIASLVAQHIEDPTIICNKIHICT